MTKLKGWSWSSLSTKQLYCPSSSFLDNRRDTNQSLKRSRSSRCKFPNVPASFWEYATILESYLLMRWSSNVVFKKFISTMNLKDFISFCIIWLWHVFFLFSYFIKKTIKPIKKNELRLLYLCTSLWCQTGINLLRLHRRINHLNVIKRGELMTDTRFHLNYRKEFVPLISVCADTSRLNHTCHSSSERSQQVDRRFVFLLQTLDGFNIAASGRVERKKF